MKKMKLLPSAVLAANLMLCAVFLSNCSGDIKNSKNTVKKMDLSLLYQGENEGGLSYWIDSTTMICYAKSGVHGFTCIPCDSLKRLLNKH